MASEDALPSVFVDTNVLFSGIYSPLGPSATILAHHASGRLKIVVSRQVVQELVQTLRKKQPTGLPVALNLFAAKLPDIAPDPEQSAVDRLTGRVNEVDAPIVAAAIAAGVHYFVTGDRRLRNEITSMGVPMRAVSPRQLLDELADA